MNELVNTSILTDYSGETPIVTPSNPVTTVIRTPPDPPPCYCRCCCRRNCCRCRSCCYGCRCYSCCECRCR